LKSKKIKKEEAEIGKEGDIKKKKIIEIKRELIMEKKNTE